MKIRKIVLAAGMANPAWTDADKALEKCIQAIKWPLNATSFKLNPKKNGNGVTTIKPMILGLPGWLPEVKVLPNGGPVDGFNAGHLVILEWETGNVGGAHRSMTKILQAFEQKKAKKAIVVMPETNMAHFLTDRVANINEMHPYFPHWAKSCENISSDISLEMWGIDADDYDATIALIPKAKTGRRQ